MEKYLSLHYINLKAYIICKLRT